MRVCACVRVVCVAFFLSLFRLHGCMSMAFFFKNVSVWCVCGPGPREIFVGEEAVAAEMDWSVLSKHLGNAYTINSFTNSN